MNGLFEFRGETRDFNCISLSHRKRNTKCETVQQELWLLNCSCLKTTVAPPRIYPRLDNTWVTLEVFTDLRYY